MTCSPLRQNEVMTCFRLADTSKLIVQMNRSRRRGKFDFFGYFTGAIHFDDATWAVFNEEYPTLGQGLASVHFRCQGRRYIPKRFFCPVSFRWRPEHGRKGCLPSGQSPAILRMSAGVFPFDIALGGHHTDFPGVRISAEKRMGGVYGPRKSDRQKRATEN